MVFSGAKVGISEIGDDYKHVNGKGFHWTVAAIFVIGDMVGGGLIVLPSAVSRTGLYVGIFLILFCGSITTYTAYQLSDSWIQMQKRWKKYHTDCRKPYGEIAFRACGSEMRIILSVILCLTQFGFATVLVLLASKTAEVLLFYFFAVKLSFCYMIVIVGFLVWPLTMLKSPMHFWQVAVFSAASSSIAVALILSGAAHDSAACMSEKHVFKPSLGKFFMAFGTITFAYGGHAAFPTIQHDMKHPSKFNKSIFLSFGIIILYYLLVGITGNIVYGSTVGDTIILSLQMDFVQQTVNTMIALHVLTTIVIVFSPMTQQIEDLIRIPTKLGWQRILIRSLLFWSIVFTALTLPNFGPLMDLIGASTMTLTSIVLPAVFYLYLNASKAKREEKIIRGEITADSDDKELATWRDILEYTPRKILYINLFIIAFGTFGGLVASITSGMALASVESQSPCYIQYFSKEGLPFNAVEGGNINCCGPFRNITVSGVSPDGYCSTAAI